MALFRRSKDTGRPKDSGQSHDAEQPDGAGQVNDAEQPHDAEQPDGAAPGTGEPGNRAEVAAGQDAASDGAASAPQERRGPWDVSDVDGLGERVDLGALWVPPGLQIGLEVGDPGGRPIAVTVSMPGTAMRIQAFAAPKSAGIWDDVRAELAEQATAGGGEADDIPGPFGRELLAQLPDPAHPKRRQPVVFWGVDGPRWFVRAVLTGQNVLESAISDRFAAIFADTVVVRGPEARAPRELLDLRAPGPESTAEAGHDSLDPMRRGPEITEIR